ncbi:MAG: uracil-DNA glycosylase [Alphaproteobacteria bacterium]
MVNKNKINALEFYDDNQLNEIYFDQPQNRLIPENNSHKEILNITNNNSPKKNKKINDNSHNYSNNSNNPNTSSTNLITPIFSTNNALASLAKRNEQITSSNSSEINSTENSTEKFIPLDQIINQAKNLAQQCQNLEELKKAVSEFDGCNLKKMATNTVFADGNPKSQIMVIGEAPGNHEDLSGIPFCGDSGQMLDDMLRAINLKRQNHYYITNVLFWRPPGNRRPTDEELSICRPFVERHIELFKPKIIVIVGATAMSALLDIDEPITKIRGQIIEYTPEFLTQASKVMTIFHPSFLMRQSAKKKLAWQDMLTLENFIQNNS